MFNAIRFDSRRRHETAAATFLHAIYRFTLNRPHKFNRLVFVDFHLGTQSDDPAMPEAAATASTAANRSIINSCERVTRAHTDNLMHETRHISVGGTFEGNFSNGRNCGLTFYVNELSEAASPATFARKMLRQGANKNFICWQATSHG